VSEGANDDIFGVTCAKFHTSYYSRRDVCGGKTLLRTYRGEQGELLHEVILTCTTAGCGARTVVAIACAEVKP
jgi:hypothetical protein